MSLLTTKQTLLDPAYAGPVNGMPVAGQSMTLVIEELMYLIESSGATTPTTLQVSQTIAAHTQMVFARKPVIGNGLKLIISNDAAGVFL